MTEPMTDEQLTDFREWLGSPPHCLESKEGLELLAEVDRLRAVEKGYLSELRDYGTTVMRLRQRIREMEDS